MRTFTKKILTKRILFVLALILLSIFTNAQGNKTAGANQVTGGTCFGEGSRIINLGFGFGGAHYYKFNKGLGYSYSSSPAISLSYEQALDKKVGPGYLGLGGYFGFRHARLRYDDYIYEGTKYYYSHNWNYYMLAARAAYHLDILNKKKGELYFGGLLGIRIQTYNYKTNSPDPYGHDYALQGGSFYPAYSLFVGGRYYLTEKLALFGEFGYGISYLTLGLTFKI
jgi:hypothetical protein